MPSPLNPLTKASQEELLAGIRATREECHKHYVAMDRALARIEAQCQAGIAICEMLGGRPTKGKKATLPDRAINAPPGFQERLAAAKEGEIVPLYPPAPVPPVLPAPTVSPSDTDNRTIVTADDDSVKPTTSSACHTGTPTAP